MDIVIEQLENTDYSIEDVFELLRSSFEERLEQGLNFTCSTMSIDTFKERTKDALLLVAISKYQGCGQLVGTATFHIFTDKNKNKYGYLEYIAASPLYKRSGICSSLFANGISTLTKAGCLYICSDTATKAKSSVRWHKKQGFRIIGLASFPSTNYYSYIFKRQLCKKNGNILYNKVSYCLSFVRVKLTKTKYGQYTHIGRLCHTIKANICRN